MRINIGGSFIEPDEGPRNTIFHRRIVREEEVVNMPCAKVLLLDCGHRVVAIGRVELCEGRVFCLYCKAVGN